ncbi:hypothetical protein GC170_12780 [bacterium]|nr:hypothetical protein [bacterium]
MSSDSTKSGNRVRRRQTSRKLFASKSWLLMAPSVVFGLAIAVVALLLVVIPDESNRRLTYEAETYRAMQTGNLVRAKNCLDSLIQLSGDNPRQDYLYQLAMLSAQAGDEDRSIRLLQRLTLPDRPGYGPAHQNLAMLILSQPEPSAESLDEAERHIRSLLETRPNEPTYLKMLAQLEILRKRPEDALKTYGLMLDADPSMGIPMGKILQDLKRDEEAKRLLEQAVSRLKVKLDQDFDSVDTRLQMAEALLLLKQFPEAARVVQQGVTLGDPSNRLSQSMGIVLGRWAASLGNTTEDQHRKLNLLMQGLSINPTNPLLLDEFWKLTMKELGTDPDQIIKLRVMGTDPVVMDMISGLIALRQGKIDDAKKQIASAVKRSPDIAVLLNNFTTVGEFRNESNDKGVELLTILLDLNPDNTNIRENRGLIFVRQQKFQQAVDDLETVVAQNPDKRTVHQALSIAYGKLGKQDLADKHSELAQVLQRNPRAPQKKEATPAQETPATPPPDQPAP